jgi:hypothetical protein
MNITNMAVMQTYEVEAQDARWVEMFHHKIEVT